jgi:putative ABC transport system ATP-binding protein
LGFVFQFFNLIPTLNVAENIRLPLALNGYADAAADARIASLLDTLGLGACAARFPEELSGGEQQRVALARALAHGPRLILADEPTGNLDVETAGQVLALLKSTCRESGTTLIVATHSNDVAGIADRVLRIRNGALEAAR